MQSQGKCKKRYAFQGQAKTQPPMNDAPTISMTGGYESRGQTFCRYRPASVVWAEFQQFWAQNHPGQALPALHNLIELTGISRTTLRRLQCGK